MYTIFHAKGNSKIWLHTRVPRDARLVMYGSCANKRCCTLEVVSRHSGRFASANLGLVAHLASRERAILQIFRLGWTLIKQVLPVAPSNRHVRLRYWRARVLALSSPPHLARSLPSPLFILALYPPSLPRAYLDARLKIDPVTAIGDILKSRAAERREPSRANGQETNGRIQRLRERASGAISAGGASSKGISSARFFRCRSTCSSSSARPPSRLGRYSPNILLERSREERKSF